MNTTGNIQSLTSQSLQFAQVLELDQRDFPRPWKAEDWTGMNWNHHLLYGWETGEGIQGFALFARIPGDDTAHLLKICVASQHRGTGLTQEFWKTCLDKLKVLKIKSIYLEVESPNQRAIKFYQKSGFTMLRTIKAYYSDGTDALTMQMTI